MVVLLEILSGNHRICLENMVSLRFPLLPSVEFESHLMVCIVLKRCKQPTFQKLFWTSTETKFCSCAVGSALLAFVLCCVENMVSSRAMPGDSGRELQGYKRVSS